jgi:hypothetical protein
MVTNTGEILHPAAPNQHHRMFLKVVPDAGNISGYLGPMGKPHPGNLSEGRIRLFGGNRHNTGTYPPFLGTGLKCRRLRFGSNLLSPETNQLINCRHEPRTPFIKTPVKSGNDKPIKSSRRGKLNISKKEKKIKGGEILFFVFPGSFFGSSRGFPQGFSRLS